MYDVSRSTLDCIEWNHVHGEMMEKRYIGNLLCSDNLISVLFQVQGGLTCALGPSSDSYDSGLLL